MIEAYGTKNEQNRIEIVTRDEFLMLLAAVGGTKAILPKADGSGLDDGAVSVEEPPMHGAHRVLSALLTRGLLVTENGRAVPCGFARSYFTMFKQAQLVVCAWPKASYTPPSFGYLGTLRDGRPGVAVLEWVAAQPGALRIRLMSLDAWKEGFLESLSEYFLPVQGDTKVCDFDGYFTAPEFLLALPKTVWVFDVCPAHRLLSEEHICRRLIVNDGGIGALIYQEGGRELHLPGSPDTFLGYFDCLVQNTRIQEGD